MRITSLRKLARAGAVRVLLAALLGTASVAAVAADATPARQPAHKDSSARLRPKEVTPTVAVTPTQAKAGDTVTYRVTVRVQEPWHIYAHAKTQPDLGPRNTEFDFFDTAGLQRAGDWTASREPSRAREEAFPDLPFLEYFEGEVTWSVPLKVPPGIAPGPKDLRCQISFQICDPKSCKPPTYWTLPEATLTVLAGGTAAAPGATTTSAAPAARAEAAKAATPVAAAPAPARAVPAAVKSEVQRASEQGLIPFLLVSALGGLIALVMPCVWPMVPITVNFFVKQGQNGRAKTTGLAITYCLAIIGIFTLVGVVFSAFFGAAALQRLANAPWLNLAVAALFFVFGLSLLGLFELRLPSFLLNASAQGEGRGGLIGVVFMALTLTITSFTCTFPVVGGLLVMAASGSYLYPVIGLATFATVLALPFFLLALAPGLLSRMPRSGDWMNAVKVVGGLVEIGAAFKFLNTAEIAYTIPEDAWFNAQALLTIWVVLALVCGIYLLGLFRTDHDHDAVKVGPVRLVAGSLFLCLALLLAPILFGQEPRSPFVKRLLSGIFPPDFNLLYEGSGARGVAAGAGTGAAKATSGDPAVATDQEKTFHGVVWGLNYDSALKRARQENKPVLIDFTGVNCANCRLMEQNVLPRGEVVPLLEMFVPIQLYTDFVPIGSITAAQREDLARANAERQFDMINDQSNPSYVALTPQGEVLETVAGYHEPSFFVAFLKRALAKHQDGGKVARADLSDGR